MNETLPRSLAQSPKLRLLQVCNVGKITGGTAACAWSITRSLPQCEHLVAFLSPITAEARAAFAHCQLFEWREVTQLAVARCDPDAIILHNTLAGRWEYPLGAPTIRYVHSLGRPGNEDQRWYCSRWLAKQCGEPGGIVCRQSVPRPLRPAEETHRELRLHPVVGRLCTPRLRKWPRELIGFYRRMSELFPSIQWEFVGCPSALQAPLAEVCRGHASFLPAGWMQRSRMWHWDALLYHHPTLTESFGRTAAEAMRAGCIPIVDARGGFIEQIAHETGYLCADVDDFAAALRVLLDPEERRRRSERCRDHADRVFSFTRFGHDLRELLDGLAEIEPLQPIEK
ncbi:MAG: glycosyltransferase [Planctomycetaceae bacterium]